MIRGFIHPALVISLHTQSMQEMTLHTKWDPLGRALKDYQETGQASDIQVYSPEFDIDYMEVAWLFRSYPDMPEIEKKALSHCSGRILDIGAGSGVHSLHLQKEEHNVLALELSKLAVEVMQVRGVKEIRHGDYFTFSSNNSFDTLLLLMNGIGICGSLEKLPPFFDKARRLLKPGGKVILDSTDVSYLYEEEDGSIRIDLNQAYYGEIMFSMQYNEIKGDDFPWLYIDFDTLSYYAEKNGFTAALAASDNYHYLAILTVT